MHICSAFDSLVIVGRVAHCCLQKADHNENHYDFYNGGHLNMSNKTWYPVGRNPEDVLKNREENMTIIVDDFLEDSKDPIARFLGRLAICWIERLQEYLLNKLA